MTADGKKVLTGFASGEVDFGAGKQPTTKNAFLFVSQHDATGGHVTSARYGDDGTSALSFLGRAPQAGGLGVALAANGETIVVGGFAGGIDFGGGILSSTDSWRNMADAGISDAGTTFATSCNECNRDIFVLKLDAAGKHVGSARFGGLDSDYATSIALLPNGAGYVIAGAFSATLDLGNGVTLTAVSSGFTDAFVARFDATGKALWAKAFAGPNNDEATQVVVDAQSNVYVTGSFRGTATLGATELTAPPNSETDAFVVKLDAQGTQAWAVKLGATVAADARGLAVDASGNVAITGTFKGVVKHGASAFQSAHVNGYVATFDAQGKPRWARGWGGIYGGWGAGIVYAADGSLITTGGVDAYGKLRIDFGGGFVDPVDEYDVYVVELNAQGEHQCSRRFGGRGGRQRPEVALDAAGKITLATSYEAKAAIGPTTLEMAGATDVMFVRLRR
jgi:hypothetical protein